jgi:hypothetical protein
LLSSIFSMVSAPCPYMTPTIFCTAVSLLQGFSHHFCCSRLAIGQIMSIYFTKLLGLSHCFTE